ncbi:erythroferrone-like isoform X2 [Mixophyes fleayi]|uniref:erythroferrone-like isoform X2 n=1 Tax=Mixophyes fleayi TaxID=3061075 RepID=UPI003F4DA613
MDAEGKPIPLRCVLMTISMGVLLVLLSAGPACTHKNRGSKFQDQSVTILPSLGIPVLTAPQETGSTLDQPVKKVSAVQSPPWPPRLSWLMFLKHSDRGEKSKRKHHRPGPIGPPAPPRHLSHPLNHVLREKKLHQLLQLLIDGLLRQKDGEYTADYGHTTAKLPSKLHAAFSCKTTSDIHLEPGNMRELYQRPHLEGSFYRGSGLNLTSGRYTAPFTGLYAFFASLHIDFQRNTQERSPYGFLRVQLCILSLCQDNLSLQQISSFTGNEAAATVTLNGMLYVQAGQYLSLFLENRMDSWLVLVKGSDFSGVLLGQ